MQTSINALMTEVGGRIKMAGGGYKLLRTVLLTGSGNYQPGADAKFIRGYAYGAGAGATSGKVHRQASGTLTNSGTSFAGAGGIIHPFEFRLTALDLPIPYVCGLGGLGGAAQTVDGTGNRLANESPGLPGGDTQFGALRARGGRAGSQQFPAWAFHPCHSELLAAISPGAMPRTEWPLWWGLAAANTETAVSLNTGLPPGRGILKLTAPAGAPSTVISNSAVSATCPTPSTEDGWAVPPISQPSLYIPALNLSSSQVYVGVNGGPGTPGKAEEGEGGTGGAAAASIFFDRTSFNGTMTAGDGGDGGFPGGGGGAGGAVLWFYVTNSSNTLKSGKGGKGGDGAIYVEEWG